MNPVIQANEQGIKLIQAVCDSALKKDGLSAFQAVSLVLTNLKLLPPVAPPQEDKPKNVVPIRPEKE